MEAVAVGEMTILAFGEVSAYVAPLAESLTVEFRRNSRTCVLPIPLTLRTLLNQMYLPSPIAVPLKFEEIELYAPDGDGENTGAAAAVGVAATTGIGAAALLALVVLALATTVGAGNREKLIA